MNATPTLSVIMPAYNADRFIALAIADVLASTYADLELIVVDDGSTDGTGPIVSGITDPRLRVIHHSENNGLTASLNEAIGIARGKYIARMDADDRMVPHRFEKQVAALEADPGMALIACRTEHINADGEITGSWGTDHACVTEVEIRAMLPRTNCIAHSTVMMRREALGDLRYDGPNEDWDLWLRMLARGKRIAKLPETLVQLRITSGSFMGRMREQASLEQRLLKSRWSFLRREITAGHCNGVHGAVMMAQLRNFAGWLVRGLVRPMARDLFRTLTYSPLHVLRERRALGKALSAWDGRNLLLFPYLCVGGAERVHASIVEALADRHPLVVIFGRSRDRGFEPRFRKHGELLEIHNLLHHPFTRKRAHRLLAGALNAAEGATMLASLSAVFFDLLPLVDARVKTVYLQHAFLHQPSGNKQWRSWLPWVPRIDALLFVSQHAHDEFDRFLFVNNMGSAERGKLRLMPNAVDRFVPPLEHERPGLLFVGRDSPEKRLRVFLKICEDLHAARPGAFRFSVVGAIGPACSAPVEFLGSVSDDAQLSRIYQDHDAIILTSEREGFPMAIMEAMAHGSAVLSTPVGDVPNRLDGSFAFIASTIDGAKAAVEIRDAVLALGSDPTRLEAMRWAAFHQARSQFEAKDFRLRYRALFDEMSGIA